MVVNTWLQVRKEFLRSGQENTARKKLENLLAFGFLLDLNEATLTPFYLHTFFSNLVIIVSSSKKSRTTPPLKAPIGLLAPESMGRI